MSAWVGIVWHDEDPVSEEHRPEAAALLDVPREGEVVIATDRSRWTVVGVEWHVAGHAVIRLRPEVA